MSTHCSNVDTVVLGEFRAREPIGDVRHPTGSALARAPTIAPRVEDVEAEAVPNVDCVCVADVDMLETARMTSSFRIAPKVTGAQPADGSLKYIQTTESTRQKPAWPVGKFSFFHETVLLGLTSQTMDIPSFGAAGKNLSGSRSVVDMERPSSVSNSPLDVNTHVSALTGLVLIVPPKDEINCRSARFARPCAR